MGLYGEAELRLDRGYLYITIINSISVTVSSTFPCFSIFLFYLFDMYQMAMHGLLYLYHGLCHDLEHIRPLLKLLCIKGILVVSFWYCFFLLLPLLLLYLYLYTVSPLFLPINTKCRQGIIVALLAKVHVIHSTASYSVEEVETGLQVPPSFFSSSFLSSFLPLLLTSFSGLPDVL